MLDIATDTSSMLLACKVDYFMQILREDFSEIRLRKHCKFAKCWFCEKWKGKIHDQSVDPATRAESKARYMEHVQWAHIRERAFYHRKKMQAEQEPNEYMSVALDGTDQMPQGFPHFRQKLKEDGAWIRLKAYEKLRWCMEGLQWCLWQMKIYMEMLTLQLSV